MSAEGDIPDRGTVGRKNFIVLVALALGILVPALHIIFIAPYLPNWLNIVIVAAVFWICFGEIIPGNTIGVFRRKK